MDYDSLIKETKKALDGYSNVNTELEALYKKAKDNNTAGYNLAKQQLNKQYIVDKNAAVTKGKLDEKDMYQYLASRGLSSSGESVQTKVDSNISINNSLSDLAQKNTNALTALEKEKLVYESELDTELADKKLNLYKWKTELAAQIAELKTNLEKSSSSGNSGSNNNGSDNTDDTKNTYSPKTSTKELAKNIIESYSTNGKISTTLQKSYIKKYLNTLSNIENIDTNYLKELIINLKAAGYTDITDMAAEVNIAVEKSKSYYNSVYDKYYNIYLKSNKSSSQAQKLAVTKAKTLMLDYIYQRCSTIQSFEKACKQAGVSSTEIAEYIKRVGNIIDSKGNSISLGTKM
ncbi:MAG: hypothetical protein A2Y15_05630 [Clostridiales bacterium GWF2_36_10]|nr:MAG: hypothetical protein A2Y15_05630 [Clostridiales bacterium GWF2_36_10]HAN21976.1 hypothetical protein [Clostridiales bacterium]